MTEQVRARCRFVRCGIVDICFTVKDFNEFLNWFEPKYDSLPLSIDVILEPLCPGSRVDLLSSRTYLEWRDLTGAATPQAMWIKGPRMWTLGARIPHKLILSQLVPARVSSRKALRS